MPHPARSRALIILRIVILSLFLGCIPGLPPVDSPEVSREKFNQLYAWVQAQKMVEAFPFHNSFELDAPRGPEKGGVLLKAFGGGTSRVAAGHRMVEIVTSLNNRGFTFHLISRQSGPLSYSVTRLPAAAGAYHLQYNSAFVNTMTRIEGEKTSVYSVASSTTRLTADVTADGGMTFARPEFSSVISYDGGVLKRQDWTGTRNFFLRDMETDETVGFYETFNSFMSFPILPRKTVRAGDQWEHQVYLETEMDVWDSTGGRATGRGYIIQLYTFELAGFATVRGRRCAIIEYIMEHYGMGTAGVQKTATKEEIRRHAKTLSRSSMAEIRAFTRALNVEDLSRASSSGQSGQKHNGIFAFDYARGIIIELHAGIQEVMGLGVKTLPVDVPVQTISRRQVVYATKSVE